MKDINSTLLDALLSNNVNIDFKTFINFNDDNVLSADEDVSQYIESVKVSKKTEGNIGTSITDEATITLDNSDNRFSPKNQSSEYAGNVVPNKYTRIEAGIPSNVALLFDGELQDIRPNYDNSKVSMKIKDITNKLKNIKCPDKFYEEEYREGIIKDLLDYAGGVYTSDSIDSTNSKVSAYFKGETVWSAIQKLSKSVWGRVFVEDGVIYFRTRLSPEYTQEKNIVKTLDNTDYFKVKENYSSKEVYNEVTVKSTPYKQRSERQVWQASSQDTSVSEQYNISHIDSKQLQLTETVDGNVQNTTNVPITNGSLMVADRTTGIEYTVENGGLSVNNSTGLITFSDNNDYPVPSGTGILDVKYSFNISILEPNKSRNFIINLDHPTTNLSNMHCTVENLTDNVELIPHGADRTITLGRNQSETISIDEPHTLSWEVDFQEGADHDNYSGSYTFAEGEMGDYTITTSTSTDFDTWPDDDDAQQSFSIKGSAGTIASKSWSDREWRMETPVTMKLKVSYTHYEYEEILPPNPDVKTKPEIKSDKQTIEVQIDNNSSKRVRLHGYRKDKEDTTEEMLLFGTPYTREDEMEYTAVDDESKQQFTVSTMGEIQNDFLATNSDIKKIADYLLYQYSTPMTTLELECKPMPDLEIMDKIQVIQEDRDIDDVFFVKEISYKYSKNDVLSMSLKLRQAYQSEFVFEDDGSYSIPDGGDDHSVTKPQSISVLNANTISASVYGDNKIRITWKNNREYGLSHYNIYRKDPNDNVFVYIGQSKKGSLRYIDSGLDYNTTYEYKITAVDKANVESDLSNSVSATTKLANTPPAPSFEGTSFTDRAVINWSEIDEADKYELRTDTNFGVFDSGVVYRGKELSTITYPTNRNVTYYLKSINDNENYSSSYATINVENTAPPAPTAPEITEFFEGLWISVNGVSDNDIQGYNIYITDTEANQTETVSLATASRVTYKANPNQELSVKVTAFDSFGEGARSSAVQGKTRSIDDVHQFGLKFRPPELVDTKPTLPDNLFPEGTTIYNTSDDTLYKNINGSWSTDLGEDEYQKILVGVVEAGAIGVEQLEAESITADAIGTNQIITDLANIRDAVIDELQVRIVTADMITVGADTTYEAGYNPYENSKQAVKIKPQGAKLWHFDKHFTSTQGEMITIT